MSYPSDAPYAHVLKKLQEFRARDAPTQGGSVLSYVYDSGRPELDELAGHAHLLTQTVNALDPTVFPSVALMERDIVDFARDIFHGDTDVFGTVTSGGTESCMLAVKTARDLWRSNRGRHDIGKILAPVTVHAAFHKAAHYFDLTLDLIPVDPTTGEVSAADLIAHMDDDVALVVVSAPNYPYGAIDPIEEIAAAAKERGIACHVDACIGGFALAWWDTRTPWDLAVDGVTSLSADLHKYGYAPKGASVLLQRGTTRQRAQYFATRAWPGYPVVNSTMLGSKPAGPLAAAWAIITYLGRDGFQELTTEIATATNDIRTGLEKIPGLRIMGNPDSPLLTVITDTSLPRNERVDPHLLADAARNHGWMLQHQPGMTQSDGTHLPHNVHLTITPVTAHHTARFLTDITAAADTVRGMPGLPDSKIIGETARQLNDAFDTHLGHASNTTGDSPTAAAILTRIGINTADAGMPQAMAPLLALLQNIPNHVGERLLIELIAELSQPQPRPTPE